MSERMRNNRLVYNGERPRWKHGHDCCRFLGRFGDADLWGCEKDESHTRIFGEPIFMARYSNEGSDYTSNLPRDPRVPEYEAKRRWYAMAKNPSMMWHADREGGCHEKCEARDGSIRPPYPPCRLLRSLPFVVTGNAIPDGYRCPFAVLADVLCSRQPPHEAPTDDLDLEHMMHLAWGCGYQFGRERPNDANSEDIDHMNADVHSLIIHERSEVRRDVRPPRALPVDQYILQCKEGTSAGRRRPSLAQLPVLEGKDVKSSAQRSVPVPLSELLSVVSCADDYGHNNGVLMDAVAKWSGWVTNEEINEYADWFVTAEAYKQGYQEVDREESTARLTEWRDRYCTKYKEVS